MARIMISIATMLKAIAMTIQAIHMAETIASIIHVGMVHLSGLISTIGLDAAASGMFSVHTNSIGLNTTRKLAGICAAIYSMASNTMRKMPTVTSLISA